MAKNNAKKTEVLTQEETPAPTEVVAAPVVNESATAEVTPTAEQQPISGRAVFAVSRVDVGIAVHTAFLAEDGRLLQMPAVFPNLEYGLQQIDEMRQMVIQQFETAAPTTN
jgi:hypothetical protein